MIDDPLFAQEQAALGALVAEPELASLVPSLLPEHFGWPHHRLVMTAVLAAVDAPGIPDTQAVLRALMTAPDGALTKVGGASYLHTLSQSCPVPVNVAQYAKSVHEGYRRRELQRFHVQLGEALKLPDWDDVAEAASQVGALLTSATGQQDTSDVIEGLHELREFVEHVDEDVEWVVPRLLARFDRVMVVASEGRGKSMLARQVAILVAQGRHPFAPHVEIPAMRTLLVDLENPPGIIRRKTRPSVERLTTAQQWTDDRAWIWTRPGGLNLRKPKDRHALEEVIKRTRPALMLIGPIYKAFRADGDGGEVAAGDVAAVLDELRERYRLALWLEHHAPLAQNGDRDLRPIGSSLWQRWAEFGLSLRLDEQDEHERTLLVNRFRADRDEREWPSHLQWGTKWPFDASWKDGMPEWLRPPQRTGLAS